MKHFFYVPLFAGIFFTISFVRANDNPASSKLNGTWVLISAQNGEMPEQILPDTFPVLFQKQFNDTHFCAVTYSKDGRVLRVNGGTYTLNGNVYTENVTYSTIQSMANTQSIFTLEMKGDEMLISGIVSDGKLKLKEAWRKTDNHRTVATKSNIPMPEMDEF